MGSHEQRNSRQYLQQAIHDPVAVFFFKDKVVVVTSGGYVVERELYVPPKVTADEYLERTLHTGMPGNVIISIDDPADADDDFQPGDS